MGMNNVRRETKGRHKIRWEIEGNANGHRKKGEGIKDECKKGHIRNLKGKRDSMGRE